MNGIKQTVPLRVMRIFTLLLCLGVGFTYVMGPALAGRPSAPSFMYLLSFIAGLVISLGSIASADKKYRKIQIVIWTLLMSVWSVWITQIYIAEAREYESFRWRGGSSLPLHHIHKALEIYLEEKSPPPSIKLLVAEKYLLPGIFLFNGSDTTLEDISIGSLSLQEFAEGNSTKEQLWFAAKQNPIQGEWEFLGDYVFSTRFDFFDKQDPKLIIGICLIPSRDGNYSVQYADGINNVHGPGSGWITAQNKYRKSLGLEPLPNLP